MLVLYFKSKSASKLYSPLKDLCFVLEANKKSWIVIFLSSNFKSQISNFNSFPFIEVLLKSNAI